MSASKIVFITGANGGLGLQILKSLCRSTQAYTILAGARDPSKGDAAIAEVKSEYPSTKSTLHTIQVDAESDSSLEAAVKAIGDQHGRLDVLVNNAGANFDTAVAAGKMSLRDGFNKSWDLNVTGAHVLTTLSVPLLLKSKDPRIIFITSGTSSLNETERLDNDIFKRLNASPPAGWPKDESHSVISYRSSKTGLNMLMREWCKRLGNDGVKIWCVSPGFLATGLAGVGAENLKKMGAQDPSVGGDFTVSVIEGERDNDVGKAIRKEMIQPW